MWKKEPPNEDGYYWVHARGQLTGKKYVHPVKVSNNGRDVFSDGENFRIHNDMFVEWWSEPIPMPATEIETTTVKVITYRGQICFSAVGYDSYTRPLRALKRTVFPNKGSVIVLEFNTNPTKKDSCGYGVRLENISGMWRGSYVMLEPNKPNVRGVMKNIRVEELNGRLTVGCIWIEKSLEWDTEIAGIVVEEQEFSEEEVR